MRSLRSRFELGCRIGVFAALGWLLGTSLISTPARGVDRATNADLESRLSRWMQTASSVALHADLDATPPNWVVDWMAALRHSGHSMTWSGSPPAVAMSAESLIDPDGGFRVSFGAPRGSAIVVRDDVGAIDSVRVAGVGASVVAPVVVGRIAARVGAQTLEVAAPDSLRLRAIAVVGGAGWEGKFVASALEERGWRVMARFSVAPNVDVAQGALSLDTSRVAAVVVIDTAIQSLGPAIERFVRSGGGLVLAGASGASSALASLAPGAVGRRLRPAVEPPDTISLGSTGFFPVSIKRDAVVLDRRPAGVAVAARRVGAGRVIQVGYDDSWRWRMAGAPGSERAHREWWARVVGSVAYVPSAVSSPSTSAAPLAHLVDRLGPARDVTGGAARRGGIDPRILIILMMICLLAEWTSRRLRGYK